MRFLRHRRWIVAVALGACLLAYLAYLALVAPSIEFLRPAFRGTWIAHPAPSIRFQTLPACSDATFLHMFSLEKVPSKFTLRVTAHHLLQVKLNDHEFPLPERRSWKWGITLDLTPYLHAGKPNQLQIRVGGRDGPPALLVEGPAEVRTDERWRVRLGSNPAEVVQAVPALRGEKFLANKLNPLRTSSKFPLYRFAWGVYLLFILAAILPERLRLWRRVSQKVPLGEASVQETPAAQAPRTKGWRGFLREQGFCLVVFLIVTGVHIHNVRLYPHTQSFDWRGHVEYIQYVAEHKRIPLATEGWEMFQPPLYYVTSAILYRLFGGAPREPTSFKAIQVYTMLAGLGNIALAWAMLAALFPTNRRARNLGFSLAAMMPMGFYMNSMISNEILSGGMIALAIYGVVRGAFAKRRPLRATFWMGVGCGLALLSKYTGLFIFLSTLLLLTLRVVTRRGAFRQLLLFGGVVLVLCGWLYVRNGIVFGDPFVGNWDPISGFHYEQPPGYRNLSFYLRFGSWLTHLPEYTRWWGFWDGKYASMWTDTHGTFLNLGDRRTQILSTLSLWLALLPTVAIVVGMGRAVRHLLTREWDHPYLILVLTTVFTFVSLIAFTMEVPTYSTVKAFFFLSLIPSLASFAALGFDRMGERLGRLRWGIYANLAALYGLILYLFWYRGT